MLLAFHKPYGVLCQFTQDQPGQRTLADFGFPPDVYPVGRLDMDSEGLLLLTDEKPVIDRLLNPRRNHSKTYLVQAEGSPSADAIRCLAEGSIILKGHRCAPASATIPDPQPAVAPREPPIRVRKNIPDTWISLTLTEGKNRQVRRMTAAIGHPTLRLIRVAIGGLFLDGLPTGTWRELSAAERAQLFLPSAKTH